MGNLKRCINDTRNLFSRKLKDPSNLAPPNLARNQTMKTEAQVTHIDEVLQNWGPQDNPTLQQHQYCKEHAKDGYNIVRMYVLIDTNPSKAGKLKDGNKLQLIHFGNVFKAIEESHRAVGLHQITTTTFGNARGHFCIIMKDIIQKYIALCPACNGITQGSTVQPAGAVMLIISHSFHH
jgi:hypothetical protein